MSSSGVEEGSEDRFAGSFHRDFTEIRNKLNMMSPQKQLPDSPPKQIMPVNYKRNTTLTLMQACLLAKGWMTKLYYIRASSWWGQRMRKGMGKDEYVGMIVRLTLRTSVS